MTGGGGVRVRMRDRVARHGSARLQVQDSIGEEMK